MILFSAEGTELKMQGGALRVELIPCIFSQRKIPQRSFDRTSRYGAEQT